MLEKLWFTHRRRCAGFPRKSRPGISDMVFVPSLSYRQGRQAKKTRRTHRQGWPLKLPNGSRLSGLQAPRVFFNISRTVSCGHQSYEISNPPGSPLTLGAAPRMLDSRKVFLSIIYGELEAKKQSRFSLGIIREARQEPGSLERTSQR